jgi:hypothetical protein
MSNLFNTSAPEIWRREGGRARAKGRKGGRTRRSRRRGERLGMVKERPSNSLRHKASKAHRIIEISCTHLKKGGILLLLVPTCPDNKMKTTMMLGPIVRAASVDGHKLPIVKPNAELVNVCSASAPRKRANFLPSLCKPAIGYKIHPKITGKNASIGNSPNTLDRTYALVL